MTTVHSFSVDHISAAARELYAAEPDSKIRLSQTYRPAICPMESALSQVPPGSRVLDVGCGAGLFLLLLGRFGRIASGHGFDVSAAAIDAARAASSRAGLADALTFETRSIEMGLPDSDASVVTALDVLHHVPPRAQRDFVAELLRRTPSGGRLIIKDMVSRPLWRAAANRLHDLVLARQLVHHVSAERVAEWVRDAGGSVIERSAANRLWYGHWSLTISRP